MAAETGATIALWPDGVPGGGPAPSLTSRTQGAPGDRILTGILSPSLSVIAPAAPNGAALLVVPGGGYMQLTFDVEGIEIAKRFAVAGFTAFVLAYRLPSEGWPAGPLAPLQDAMRAMRQIRASAGQYGFDPARVGAMGFSAGGHLVANLAARTANPVYPPSDDIDRLDARPHLVALGYPVITMLPPYAHEASREHLLGANATAEQRMQWSAERTVGPDMPPAFLFAAADDPYVPIENTLAIFNALRANKADAELHVFERGGHGFGLRAAADTTAAEWPDIFLRWADAHDLPARATR